MKSKKILSLLMAGSMVLSLAACGGEETSTTPTPTEAPKATEAPEATEAPAATDAPAVVEEASIDFEDGNMGFMAPYMQMADAAEIELSVVDYNGSKALQVKNLTGKIPYVAIDATSLLGADVAKVAYMEYTIGVANDADKFAAASGFTFAWSGEDRVETSDEWAVYLEKANPKKAVATLSVGEEFVADAGNIFFINLKTDNAVDLGYGNSTFYIDNIRFLDADGNLLKADSSVAFVAPEGFESSGVDMSNIALVKNAVNFEGFACSEGAWTQNGFEMPQEIIDALVPGAVVEIEYTSENGDMWIVMPDATVGWSRVADGGASYVNNSKTVAQITYEQIAAVCGEDKSTWGARMQCEASGAWEVYSVKVGQAANAVAISNPVEFPGFACSEGAWTQNGFEMPQEIIDALVPGSVVEIAYTSENNDMWIVMPDATVGWSRVADGGNSLCTNGKCYVTYEQIAAVCGEDKSTWGARMQCEASGAWEVYSVKVGTAKEIPMVNKLVEFPGFACSEGAWTQNGFEMPQEIIDALVPGSVVEIAYTSENNDMWIVMPDATVGWSRVADGGNSICDNGICYVTYEQIAAVCGEDKSTWGARMQCEASGAWEVYSVKVGQSPVVAE